MLKPLLFVLLFTSIFSCVKKVPLVSLTDHDWKLEKLQILEDPSLQVWSSTFPEIDHILKFQSDSEFTINLDVNNCFGSYSTSQNIDCEFNDLGCSEACCDSEFSEELIRRITKASKFEITGDKLIIGGSVERAVFIAQ